LKIFGATNRHKRRAHVTSAEIFATGALTGSDFSPTLASLWVYVIILSIVIGVALDFADVNSFEKAVSRAG
jgi:hypothetical protein